VSLLRALQALSIDKMKLWVLLACIALFVSLVASYPASVSLPKAEILSYILVFSRPTWRLSLFASWWDVRWVSFKINYYLVHTYFKV
jgi:hypothetical protein